MEKPKPMPEAYYSLLEKIQAVDFVLLELNLYLDTHPNDADAIEQYNESSYESRALKKEFEEKFGPLMNYGASYSDYPFDWATPPWPWQV
ncbi:spore coat protein JB [Natronobacillus azotifigens]|uniref:Spore coat protein CotJB n=1 Tax=Natronobacillus azotifigens TaxID=472978 RepID=A0A9J6R866_9BACI|nr:spore coat protein CotJB [Natronobacillus azotifigens]MCZ0701840.1 spore coat protein CotJB [Natronobacillus azotifigens]